ncbi:hypothetical protein SRHO_G00257960 [Serrasalmus rhombeus]
MKGVGGEDGERERRRERDGDSARLKSKQAGLVVPADAELTGVHRQLGRGLQVRQVGEEEEGRGRGAETEPPPPREGVVEGAEASHEVDERLDLQRIRLSSGAGRSAGNGAFDNQGGSGPSSGPPSEPPRACKGKPSWMGSPPESVLTELKRSKERQPDGQDPPEERRVSPERRRTPHLRTCAGVGCSEPGTLAGRKSPEQKSAKNQKGRLPSARLSLDRSVLDLVVQSDTPVHPDAKCEVRALCHHIATETGHLSFHKGDVLQVLGRADSDWLLCALGDTQGLVPIIYVTLNSKESRGSQGPQ